MQITALAIILLVALICSLRKKEIKNIFFQDKLYHLSPTMRHFIYPEEYF